MTRRRSTFAATFVFLVLAAGMAPAQESKPAGAAPAAEPQPATAVPSAADTAAARSAAEEEIVVTGSRVRRKDLTTPAPVTVLTRQQLQESGKVTIGEFLQMLPEQGNSPNFQLNNGGATYSADGSTRINLRSLGVTRTLVLVNGRRFVNSGVGASSSVDLNSIPAAAVERIEVLKDGASAIYGSDAIAGVVNVITRKTFNGTEASAQYGVSGHGDANTFDGQVTTGRSGTAGNFLFSVGYFNQGDSWLRDRDWSANALTYNYATQAAEPGGSRRTPNVTIGLPQNPDTSPLAGCMASPTCSFLVNNDANWRTDNFIQDPAARTAANPQGWRVATAADRYNFAAENYLTIPSNRVQVYSSGDTRFSGVRGYYEASYVQRNSQQNAAPMPLNPGDYPIAPGSDIPIAVSAFNQYNPFGVEPTFAGRRLVEFGHREYKEELGTFRVVTGLDGTLPEPFGPLRGWYWDVSLNYGRSNGTFTTAGAIRNSRIADAVGPSMPDKNGNPVCVKTPGDLNTIIPGCVPLNLFSGPNNGSISPSQISGLGFEGTSRAFDQLFSVGANATGELFKLMADRPVSLALGYEFRRQSGAQIADPMSIPVISNVPGVQDLEASVAGRSVNYDTFGGKFTYKFGARYTPVRDLTVRGTYSTAFRAPTISELYLGQSETAPPAADPCKGPLSGNLTDPLVKQCTATGAPATGSGDQGNQELAHQGGNRNLSPETAKIFTAGVVVQPRMVRDLSITLDYYHMTVDNLVGTIGTSSILAGCYPAASPATAANAPAYCDLITRSDVRQGGNGRILFVTDVNQNVGQLSTAGIDFAIRYALPTDFGRLGLLFDLTWLEHFDKTQTLATGTQVINAKGTYDLGGQAYGGPLPQWKFNAGANWRLGGLSAGTIVRYVGTFRECAASDLTSAGGLCYVDPTLPARQTGHNVVVDLNASYVLPSPAGRTVFMVGVNNVFDQSPQFVYSAALANSDPTVYDYVGRFVYGRVQHTF